MLVDTEDLPEEARSRCKDESMAMDDGVVFQSELDICIGLIID